MKLPTSIFLTLFFCISFSTTYSQSKTGNRVSQPDISVSRNVSATRYSPGGEPMVVITLIINKNTAKGHALIEEDFSGDLEATVIKNSQAKFQNKGGKATFEWVNIPTDNNVTVSYQLKAINKTTDDQAVSGQFTYQNKTYTISPSSFSLKIVTGEPKPKPIPKKDTVPAKTKPANTNPAPASGGLIYRIQIAAVGDKLQADDILKQYKITDEPYLEAVNAAALRLMIGSYPNLSSAKARINELKSKGLTGAYVVPYYKGKRITLQEAAMHTQQ